MYTITLKSTELARSTENSSNLQISNRLNSWLSCESPKSPSAGYRTARLCYQIPERHFWSYKKVKRKQGFIKKLRARTKRKFKHAFRLSAKRRSTFFFKKQRVSLALKKKRTRGKLSTMNWNLFYLQNVIRQFTAKKTVLLHFNLRTVLNRLKIKKKILQLFRRFSFFKNVRLMRNVVLSAYSSLFSKDLLFFSKNLRNIMSSVHYTKHKKYFTFWRYLVLGFLKTKLRKFSVLGFYLRFKGKLGVGGNAKKRNMKCKTGINSNTSKIIKTTFEQNQIWTKTGCVGYELRLFF